MKIGIDARLWSESGVGRHTRNLIKNLQILDSSNDYTLFVRSRDYENVKCQMSNVKSSMENARLPARQGKWKIVKTDIKWHTIEEQLWFPSVLDRESLDFVHFPYVSVPIFYNKPFVVTIHDLILHHFPTGLASTLPHWLYKLKLIGYKFVISKIAKKAKKIITVSNATKKEIVDHLKVSKDKVVVVYEGIFDSSKFKVSAKVGSASGRQSSKLQLKVKSYFLYVGNAYPHKNLERLLEGFSTFCHPELVSGSQLNRDSDFRQNDTKLVLVGKEDYFYKRLKRKVEEMKLSNKVIFLQNVSDEELSGLYKNALALIVPSLMEGFGLPALEAMANNCLVLASDIPALREVCVDAAIYFNPYNTEEIAQKITSVLHFNDMNHYSGNVEKGFERSKMFSWEKMARETLRIYESCIGS